MKDRESKIKHVTDYRVIYADTDAMGILYHANYYKLFERGRTEYLRDLGLAYAEFEKKGLMLPLTSSEAKYFLPAIYDDLLTISTKVEKLGGASILLIYNVYRKSTNELLATGHTAHAITDRNLKPIRVKNEYPDFYEKLLKSMK